MNSIDLIIGGLIVIGLIRGIIKGLILEVASLFALNAGIYGAIHFSYFISSVMHNYVSWDEKNIEITAFILTFILVIVLVTLLGKLITKIVDFASLGLINRLLGGLFGALKVVVVFSAFMVFFHQTNKKIRLVSESTVEASLLYEPIMELGAWVFSMVLEDNSETSTTH